VVAGCTLAGRVVETALGEDGVPQDQNLPQRVSTMPRQDIA